MKKLFSSWITWVMLLLIIVVTVILVKRNKDLKEIEKGVAYLKSLPATDTWKAAVVAQATEQGITIDEAIKANIIFALKESKKIWFTK